MVDLEKVREIADRVAVSHGLEVVEVEFRGGAGKQRLLRVFVEKNEEGRRALRESAIKLPRVESRLGNIDQLAGVTHEDCANFSTELSTILDVEDPIPGSMYLLEVSSPGLDRKLTRPEEFQRFQGNLVKLMTREPIQGNRHWQGRLTEFSSGRLRLDTSAGQKVKAKKKTAPQTSEVEIEFANVEKANLVPEV